MSDPEANDFLAKFGLGEIEWANFFNYDLEQNGYRDPPPDVLYKYLSPSNFEKFCRTLKLRVSQKPVLNDVFEFRGRAKAFVDGRFRAGIKRGLGFALRELVDRPDFLFFLLKRAAIQNGVLISPDQAAHISRILLDPSAKLSIQQSVHDVLGDWEKIIDQYMDILADALNSPFATEQMLRSVGMLCLSEKPLSQPMWAHYADGGKGAVVGIRTSSIRFFRPPSSVRPQSAILGRVRYADEIADCIFDDIYSVFLNKNTEWAYESEWRAIYKLDEMEFVGEDIFGHNVYLIGFEPKDIVEIYFGYNFNLDLVMSMQVPLIVSGVSARTCYVTGFSVEGLAAEHCVGG